MTVCFSLSRVNAAHQLGAVVFREVQGSGFSMRFLNENRGPLGTLGYGDRAKITEVPNKHATVTT